MTRWRNSKDLFKTDTSSISEQEFRTTVIRILAGLERSIEDTRETLVGEMKNLNNVVRPN